MRTHHHQKKQSAYHVVIIPEGSSHVHRMRVSRWQYRFGWVLGVVLVVGLAVSAGGYWRYHGLYQRTAEMRARYAVVQQKQAQLTEQLAQLQQVVQRAENLAGMVGSLVQVAPLTGRQGLGPVDGDRGFVNSLHPLELGFASLGQDSFADRLPHIMSDLKERSFVVEQKVTEAYENYQDRMVRLASTPDIWPVLGWMTSRFGPRRSPITHRRRFHEGVDIAAPWGIKVRATGDGIVRYAGYKSGLGNTVVIDHGFGIVTYYGHNSKIYVEWGQKVTRGLPIAAVGNTGHSTGPHLHYEIQIDGVPVDPMTFLPSRTTTASTPDLKKG